MATITLPSGGIRRTQMRLVRGDAPLDTFTGNQVVVESVEATWFLRMEIVPLSAANARAWKAALVQLSRLVNTFDFTPPEYTGNSASYAGADPLVAGASQLGRDLDCDGVSNSTAIALAGDYIGVNGELKMLTANATSDGAGAVTFDFEPALRQAPADNAVVELDAPVATFRLLQPVAEWAVEPPYIHQGIVIDAREAY